MKSLSLNIKFNRVFAGNQHPEYECRARGPDVQKLPVKRPLSFRRYPHSFEVFSSANLRKATDSLKDPS